jgi:hypothetical protein
LKSPLFHPKLGLSNWRNLLRYIRTWKDPSLQDGAADVKALRGLHEGSQIVSQPVACTRTRVREEPRWLEGEVQEVAGTNQGVPHQGEGPASRRGTVAGQGREPGTGAQRTACRDGTTSQAAPPRAELANCTGPEPAFELIPARHQFGSVQILLMLGWVLNGISLRGTCIALDWMLEIDVEWGFDFPVPHCTTVRLWLLRLGHYKLHRPKEHASDWVWIIDHSNQIGKEKCLVILGVRISQLPPPGEEYPLHLAQMEPIELEPVTVSDKEVVYRQLEANVAKTGVPRAIIDDHGGDLAGGVELFRQAHPETMEIYDISHKAACLLKAQLEHDEQWKAFAAQAGQTKCKIQQTEWAPLVPPSQRLKARYMNLEPLITWGVKTLALLDNPSPEILQYGTVERLEEKLGWLRPFRAELKVWSELAKTINVTIDAVRTQGLYRGAAKDLGKRLGKLCLGERAAKLGEDLRKFLLGQEHQLKPGERLPACSEVIESCFGKFKTLEREQANGGFTSLVLALAACVAERTQEVIHEALQKTKTRDVIDWVKRKLGATVGSKRRIAYRAGNASLSDDKQSKSATKPEGTPLLFTG